MKARELGSTLCIRGWRCGGSGIGPMKRTPASSSHWNVAGISSHRMRRSAGLSRASSSGAKAGMSAQWSAGESTMDWRRWCGVPVDVIEPIDQAVDPPRRAFFSSSTTLRPSVRASMAAARPQPPPPTTTTSNVSSPHGADSPEMPEAVIRPASARPRSPHPISMTRPGCAVLRPPACRRAATHPGSRGAA